MKKTYKPLIIGGLIVSGFILYRKAKAARDPYRAMFEGQANKPTTIEPGKIWIVQMRDGTNEEMTSAELQRIVNTGRVAGYVDKGQI